MKKRVILISLSILLLLCLLPVTVLADADNFSDGFGAVYDRSEYDQLKEFFDSASASSAGYSNGRSLSYMYSNTDPSHWTGVTWTEYDESGTMVNHVTSIDFTSGTSTYSLDGDLNLSNFPHLTSFKLDYAQIDSLNVTGDTALTELICTRTKMTDGDGNVTHTGVAVLDLSTNINLQYVSVGKNSIADLNTSAAGTNLTNLYCSQNKLASLNISGNTKLEGLDCFENELTGTLDLTGFSSLYALICYDNGLTELILDGCTMLYNISCLENDLGTLDVTDCEDLGILACRDNSLTLLNTDGLTALSMLDCGQNKLGTLDVSENTALDSLNCAENQITSLTLTNNTALTSLTCNDNQLSELNVSLNTKLKTLYCQNNTIGTLSVASNTDLTTLDCSDNALTALNVSANAKMQILRCYDNALGSLNVSDNMELIDLDCSNCGLSALDVHANAKLDNLNCSSNSLGSLDISHNAGLSTLDCGSCGLSSLDISGAEIMLLICADNKLTSLNLSGAPALYLLDISGNRFADIDLSGVACYIMDCTDNPLTHLKGLIAFGYDVPADTKPVELTANGDGYVGLYSSLVFNDMTFNRRTYKEEAFAQGTPKSVSSAFYNWTDAAHAAVSTSSKVTLVADTAYDLTANFFSLTSSVADGKIYVGGRVTLTPNIDGGIWNWDKSFFTATFNSPATFTALKAGTSTITYTVSGASITYTVTVAASSLPSTG